MKVSLDILRPTQFCVGKYEVIDKVKQFSPLLKHLSKLKDRLRMSKTPVVKGPGDNYYLIDSHHRTCALFTLGITEVYVNCIKDYSHLSVVDFWKKMVKHEWVYLRDRKGNFRTVDELPTHFSGLKDDPYRSLAALCRDKGCFDKTAVPYAEFQWAEYFRMFKCLPDDWDENKENVTKAVKESCKLARMEEAKNLPGFKHKYMKKS